MPKIIPLLLIAICCLPLTAVGQASSSPAPASSSASYNHAAATSKSDANPTLAADSKTAALSEADMKDQAWELLLKGTQEHSPENRAIAVRVLSFLKGEARAVALAIRGLDDPKPQVRMAAAFALGELHATTAIPKLEAAAFSDKEPQVVLAAAHSLVTLKDSRGYEVYYEILTGERKGGKGLVAGQLETLKDPKKMALLGFQEGIGFVPFAGIGYSAIKAIIKDDSSPVRAAAAKVLAEDHDRVTEDALVQAATQDKSALVRTAALDALSHRDDPTVIGRIAPAMSDDKDSVKYTAAAAILHLIHIEQHGKAAQKQ
jgi:HEAT repeat protein